MQGDSMKAIGVRAIEIMADGSREDFEEIVHPEFLNHEASDEPPGSRGRGPAAAHVTALWLRDAYADLRWDIHEVLAEGNLVVAHCTMSGRHVRPFLVYDDQALVKAAFPPTGRRFATRQTHWMRIADGKLIEHWANRDDLGTAEQLGWVPPSPLYLLRGALAMRGARRATARAPGDHRRPLDAIPQRSWRRCERSSSANGRGRRIPADTGHPPLRTGWDRGHPSRNHPCQRSFMHPLHLRPRPIWALLTGASLLLAASFALPSSARAAATAPVTLARTASVGDRPQAPPIRVDFLGVHWGGTTNAQGAVRFRLDGEWGKWQVLHRGDVRQPGRFASALVAAGGATAYQVRAPEDARDVRAVAINTSDGPHRPLGPERAGVGEPAQARVPLRSLCYRDRAAWGADEALRFDATGGERWAPEYFPVQRLTVHHTVTESGASDPAAVVRAIYRYHAVDLGFGDIGYQLLVDHRGCVYEGRSSGPDGVPVLQGRPVHGAAALAVNGGHVAGFNAGNVGVALIGEFTAAEPSRPALRSLTRTLAVLAAAAGLDPLAGGTYVNPISGATRQTAVISGHRDWLATECPGERLYALLAGIRQRVATLVGLAPH